MNSAERIPIELLQVHLAEYNSLRDEILSSLDTQRQLLSLELAVIGVAISGIAFFQAQPALYLFGAFLLGLLSWIMTEQTLKIQYIHRYIRDELSGSVRTALFGAPSSDSDRSLPVWLWIQQWLSVSPSISRLALLASAKFMLGFALAIAFCVLFIAAKDSATAWTSGEVIAFAIDIMILLIAAVMGLYSAFDTAVRPWLRRRDLISSSRKR